MQFRRYLAISGVAHGALLVATLIAFPSAQRTTESMITSIPLELVDDISNDPQMAGERDGQRSETPQRREVARPAPTPLPTPPPERPRPVDPSSAPAPTPPPPPPPQEAAPAPAPTPPVPTPPAPPPRPQVAETQEPPDAEGLLRRIEEERRREEQARADEQRRQEQARREEQRRQEQARQEEQRRQEQARQEQARREEQARQEQARREEQRRQEQARQEQQRRQEQARREEQRRQQQAQQQQFNAQQMRDLINRQDGAPTQTGTVGNNTRTASLGNPQGTGRRLTQSQFALLIGMIRDQIQPCWSPPSGGIAGNRIVVRIEIVMNRDGTLNGRPRVMNASNDPQFRAIADSASRAIIRCSANGLRLPAEMYDAPNGWREIEFAFDPSQMS